MVDLIQVGLGVWGRNWAEEVLPTVPGVNPVAFVDPSAEARASAADRLGIPPDRLFASLSEAASAVPADLVLAPVRTAAHHPVVMEALSLGFHVMVEKPFAISLAEAREMAAAADAAGRILMVSQNYRVHPAPIRAAELIASDVLGKLNLVSIDFRRHGPTQGYRYWDMPHPLLADMSIHHFDLMRMVLGRDPVRVSCRTWNPGTTPFVHDPLGVATMEFADEVIVSYRGSWISGGENTPWSGVWSMDCERGEIRWSSRNQDMGVEIGPDWVTVRPLGGAPSEERLPAVALKDRAGALAAMVQAVSSGRTPPRFSSGRDNVMSLALVEATILSAARRGEWIDIAELFA